jgi:hypothetical protein
VPVGAAAFEPGRDFGASVSFDYVNQALFAVWKQGLLNRKVSDPVEFGGLATDAIYSDAKLPPVVMPHPNGKGLLLNIGELQLTTVFRGTSGGSAKVRLAVSVLGGANIALGEGGETLVITPTDDETNTRFVGELIGIPEGSPEAAEELASLVTSFTPFVEALIAHDFSIPPIAIPALDLGKVSPGFAGKKGRFSGDLRFNPTTSRVSVEGSVLAF